MNKFTNLIIDPSNLRSLFHPQNKFMIFKRLAVYEKIYIDKLLMTQTAEIVGNNVLKNVLKKLEKRNLVNYIDTTQIIRKNSGKYKEWFEDDLKLFEDNVLNMWLIRRIKEKNYVVPLFQTLGVQSLLSHLRYAQKKNGILLIPPWLVEEAIQLSKKISDLDTEKLKAGIKHVFVSSFLIREYAPRFQIDKENIAVFLDAIKKSSYLNDFVTLKVKEFRGYLLREAERESIKRTISRAEQNMLEIKNGLLRDLKMDLGFDLASDAVRALISSSIPGVGAAKTLITHATEKHRIKKQKLEWIVYLRIIRAFQTKGEEKLGPCDICALSMSEINSMNEEEAESMVFSGSMCEGHTILYLNIRKQTQATGKDLLRLMKKYENSEAHRLGAPLGGAFIWKKREH
ncbi:MAG: hypothetical protein E3J91_01475 [Hadesarchaea archaeon]|nr:MAG: hypothetical protein E3J91_01475 [Hadesarchaea archaeon]